MTSFGTLREHKVRDWFLERDWWVCRAAGSMGDADLVALKVGQRPRMIEVKGNAGSPWMNFRAKDRADLLFAAHLAGADAVLAHYPPRGKLRFYTPDEWPTTEGKR